MLCDHGKRQKRALRLVCRPYERDAIHGGLAGLLSSSQQADNNDDTDRGGILKILTASLVAAIAVALPAASSAATQHNSNVAWCRIALARAVTMTNADTAIWGAMGTVVALDAKEYSAYQAGDSFTAGALAQQATDLTTKVQTVLIPKFKALAASFNAARARC